MGQIKDKEKISKDVYGKLYSLKKESQSLRDSETPMSGSGSLNSRNRIKSLSLLAKSNDINLTN